MRIKQFLFCLQNINLLNTSIHAIIIMQSKLTQVEAQKLTKAIVYFQQPLTMPLKQETFSTHLASLSFCHSYQSACKKVYSLLVQRYYEAVHQHYSSINQWIIIDIVKQLKSQSKVLTNNYQNNTIHDQLLIVLIWSLISHTKNSNHKQQTIAVLEFLQQIVRFNVKSNVIPLSKLYPQIYSYFSNLLIGTIINQSITHQNNSEQQQKKTTDKLIRKTLGQKGFGLILKILGFVIQKNLENIAKQTNSIKVNGSPQDFLDLNKLIKEQSKQQNGSIQRDFIQQSLHKLNENLKLLLENLFSNELELSYKSHLRSFISDLKPYVLKIVQQAQLKRNLVILDCLLQNYNSKEIECSFTQIERKYLKQQAKQCFLIHFKELISASLKFYPSEKSHRLKLVSSFLQLIQFQVADMEFIVGKGIIGNLFFLLPENQRKIGTLTLFSSQPISLIELQGSQSFKDHQLTSLLDSYHKQERQLFVTIANFSDKDFSVAESLLFFATAIANSKINCIKILSYLIDSLIKTEYTLEMSVTEFYQYLTKVLVIKLLLQRFSTENLEEKLHQTFEVIVLKLFDIMVNSQALKLLAPSYKEQEFLISLSLFVSFYCYNHLLHLPKYQKGTKKLRYRISMFTSILNNLSQDSYIIRITTYYIILQMSAPKTISEALQPLQSTIIHHNLNNINIVANSIKYGKLPTKQCQKLAEIYFFKHQNSNHLFARGSIKIMKLLIGQLQPPLIRKCLLASPYWPQLLRFNVSKINNKQIPIVRDKQNESDYFSSNDGQNVRITNALGVIVLQLKQKWLYELKSPRKQFTIDIMNELISVNKQLVFFKRFIIEEGIFKQLSQILKEQSNKKMQENKRMCTKIITFLIQVPQENFAYFYPLIQFKQLIEQIMKPIQKILLFQSSDAQLQNFYDGLVELQEKIQRSILKKKQIDQRQIAYQKQKLQQFDLQN